MNSLYPWRVFLLVVEHGSFRRAADALQVSPSAVSHVILKLEEDYGLPLFTRSRSQLMLTACGEQLLPAAHALINSADALEQQLLGLRDVTAGAVRVAGFNSACAMWMPEILRRFNARYPQVDVTVYQQGDETLRRMVERGDVDLAFLSEDMAEGCDFMPLHRTPLVCLAPRGYVPVNGGCVTAADLEGANIILQADGYDTEIRRYLNVSNLNSRALCRMEVDATCHSWVEEGLGLCITPEMTFRASPRDVSVWPVSPAVYRVVGLVTVFPDSLTPSARRMRETIVDYMREAGLVNVDS